MSYVHTNKEEEAADVIRTTENDVLLGRGGNNHSHCGNEQLRRMANARVDDYIAATKKQKAAISKEILHQIQMVMEPPGRFLLYNYTSYEWDVVSDAVAREKVCQALRDAVAMEKEKIESQANFLSSVQEQDEESLPNVLDELSSEQFQRSDKSIITPSRRSSYVITPREHKARNDEGDDLNHETYHYGGSDSFDIYTTSAKRQSEDDHDGEMKVHKLPKYITPARHMREVDSNEDTNHHRGVSDDFDLFDGELLSATEDDVLATAAKKIAES